MFLRVWRAGCGPSGMDAAVGGRVAGWGGLGEQGAGRAEPRGLMEREPLSAPTGRRGRGAEGPGREQTCQDRGGQALPGPAGGLRPSPGQRRPSRRSRPAPVGRGQPRVVVLAQTRVLSEGASEGRTPPVHEDGARSR